jgi:hypothetical protein
MRRTLTQLTAVSALTVTLTLTPHAADAKRAATRQDPQLEKATNAICLQSSAVAALAIESHNIGRSEASVLQEVEQALAATPFTEAWHRTFLSAFWSQIVHSAYAGPRGGLAANGMEAMFTFCKQNFRALLQTQKPR